MTIHAYPYPPLQPTGDWIVRLPGEASIGEVIVYASTTVIPSTADYEWRFDGSLTGTNGADPFATPGGSPAFVPGLRGDGAGQALRFGGAGDFSTSAGFDPGTDAGFAAVIVLAAPAAAMNTQVTYGLSSGGFLSIFRNGTDVRFRTLNSGSVVTASVTLTSGATVVAAMYHDTAAGKIDITIDGAWTDDALSVPGSVLAAGTVALRHTGDLTTPSTFDECAVWVGPHDRSVVDAYIAQLL